MSRAAGDDKLMPMDLAAEECLVAAMLLGGNDADLFASITDGIDRDSFAIPELGEIWDACVHLRRQGINLDAVTLRSELLYRGKLDEVGGMPCIARLLNAVPSCAHGPDYAATVRLMARRRKLLTLVEETRSKLMDATADVNACHQALLDRASSLLGSSDRKIRRLADVLVETYDSLSNGGRTYLRTGHYLIDANLGGIGRRGEMVVIAARPSMGKSLVGKDVCYGVAETMQVPVGIVSIEEPREKIGGNYFAGRARVENQDIARGRLSADAWPRMAEVIKRAQSLPVYIDDESVSLAEVEASVRIMAAKHGCQMVMVDYLQLIEVRGERGETREQQVARVSKTLKRLAKQLDILLLVLAQLNRANEHREGQRPFLSDLRESGQIEQDADRVLLLHREDYYHRGDPSYEPTGDMEIIVAKNRNGSRGEDIRVRADLRYQRIAPPPSFQDDDDCGF